jgi:HK97 family phage portal protein
VTAKSAEGIAAFGTCLSILSDAVATAEMKQYRKVNGKVEEIDPCPLVVSPWSEVRVIDFKAQVIRSMAARGNAWGRVASRDRRGYPTQIVLVHPDNVRVRRDTSSGEAIYKFGTETVDVDDVFHVPYQMEPGSILGINPIEQYRNTLGLAIAGDQYASSFFSNSARPDGVITIEGDLDEDEAKEVADQWLSHHQGIGNAHLPAIMSGGATFQPISISPKDAQFIEARQLSKADVGSIFRVPQHKLGNVDRSPVAVDVESQEIEFVRDPLLGYIKRYEDAMSALMPAGQFVRFDLSDRLRGATLARYQGYAVGRSIGALVIDEIREKEGLEPFGTEWSTDPMAPLNSAQNGSLVNPTEANPNDPTKIDQPSN